jgi:hypothetical protein
VGTSSLLCEVELVQIVADVFSKLGIAVTLKLNNRSLQTNTLYVYASADSGPGTGGWLNDTTFWITSFYVTLCRTAEEVDTLIEELVEADVPAEEFAENELYLKTMEAFSELSPIKRTFVTKSQEFKNLLKEKSAVITAWRKILRKCFISIPK